MEDDNKKEMQEIKDRLLAGDKEIADKAIMGFLNLGNKYVWAYHKKTGKDVDDLKGIASLAIVRAIHSILNGGMKKRDKNIESFIITAIIRSLRDEITADHLIRLPMNQVIEQLKETGDVKHIPVISRYKDFPDIRDCLPEDKLIQQEELDKICYNICKDEQERQVVNLLIQGYNHPEIADHLGKTRQRISQLIKQLKRRYKKFKDEQPDNNY